MYFSLRRKVEQADLVGQFTPKEATRVMTLRRQYRAYPDRYKFDVNYRRLEFARWLVVHGYLCEWPDSPADQHEESASHPSRQCEWRCA